MHSTSFVRICDVLESHWRIQTLFQVWPLLLIRLFRIRHIRGAARHIDNSVFSVAQLGSVVLLYHVLGNIIRLSQLFQHTLDIELTCKLFIYFLKYLVLPFSVCGEVEEASST